jgi:microcystin-dependent protein
MAWSITDLFPSWGDSGEQPPDGFQYDGGDQVNEKHLDYLWSSVGSLEDEVRAALDDLDDDGDGVVDEADYANDADASTFKGNDLDANGDGVVDEADDTTTVKGNDIDTDGDGRVDAADDATTVKGNDIDSDGDGTVNEADSLADPSIYDASQFSGSDGTSGQVLQTDGSTASWNFPPTVESGIITIWSGSISNVPSGWVLCDGNNGTPDLENRFVVGAGDNYSVGATGGSNTHTLTESEMPSHNHSFDGNVLTSKFNNDSGYSVSDDTGSDSLEGASNNTGGDSAHENRPPYYALAYIQKV